MREQKKKPAPDFDLVAVKKFDSDEPEYEIDFVRQDQTYGIHCQHKEYYSWAGFRRTVHKRHEIDLADCGQEQWEILRSSIKPTIEVMPREISVDGMVEDAIDKLVDNASEKIKAWKITSRHVAIFDIKEDLMMIRTEAICNAVRDEKVPVTRQRIGRILSNQGWVNRNVKIDSKSSKFWVKKVVEGKAKKIPEEKKEPPMDDQELF